MSWCLTVLPPDLLFPTRKPAMKINGVTDLAEVKAG